MIDTCSAIDCLEAEILFQASSNSCLTPLDIDLSGESSTCTYVDESGINMDIIEAAVSEDYEDINDYLRKIRKSCIAESLQMVVNQHKELTQSRTIIDNLDITKGLTYFSNKVQKNSRFVGIEIKPSSSQTIAVMLRKLGVQFDALNTTLTLYFYETSQETAIQTITLTAHNKTNSLQWFALTDFIASYKYEDGGTGQQYILGYFEDDLSGQAIDTRLYSNCCGNEWVSNYQSYVWFRGCAFPAAALSGTNLPDMEQIGYTDQSFGLHLKSTITCDITETICQNAKFFVPLIRKKMALRIFWDFFNSTRLNRKTEMAKDRATTNITRLEAEIKAELKGMSLDLTDIDRACMPCSKSMITSVTMR
jgi:hypothetical protein